MPLPLPVRKGIRDYEPNLKENLETIHKVTGKEFTVEIDWEGNLAQFDPSYAKENIGYLYQKEVMGNVAYNIENQLKDELVKEAFNEATSNNKIVFRVNDKAANWWNYKFENGDFIIEHKKSIYNTGDVSYITIANFLPAQGGALPVPVRQNIEENKPTRDEYLESIAKTTGTGEWTVEENFDTTVPQLDKNTAERIGKIYYGEALYGIDYLLKNKLANEITKEAFNEATPERKIIFRLNNKINNHWTITFENGALLVQHKKDIYNVGDLSYYNIEKEIPTPGLISLVSKLSLDEKKDARQTALDQIKEATGEEWTFDDSSVEAFYEKISKEEKERIGSILYGEALTNLAYNLTNALKDEMVKEAFLETASAKQIAVRVDNKQSNYWEIKFENGVLVLSTKSPIYNTGDISYISIEKLL